MKRSADDDEIQALDEVMYNVYEEYVDDDYSEDEVVSVFVEHALDKYPAIDMTDDELNGTGHELYDRYF